MNKKQLRALVEFPYEIDEAVQREFGAATECKSGYDFFSGRVVTVYKGEDRTQEKSISDFITGYMKGWEDLKNKIESLSRK